LSFLEKLFGKKKEKKVVTPTETSFNLEAATAFLKKKYDDNLQLVRDEIKAAKSIRKRRISRKKAMLNLLTAIREKELLNPVVDAEKELDSLKKNIEDVEKNKKEIDEHNKRLLDLKKKLESEEENLRELEASDEWDKFNQLIKRKTKLDSQISGIRSEISKNFSKIKKPLKKFQHLVEVGKEEIDDKKTLNRYLDSPVDALIETENFLLIDSVLERVKRSISSNEILLKDPSKTLSEIDWMIDNNVFEALVTKHNSMIEGIKKLEEDMDKQNVDKSKSEIASRIDYLERNIQATTSEIERDEKQIEKIEVSIQEGKARLETSLATLIGSKVTLTLASWCFCMSHSSSCSQVPE
jgi:DNA repair exonuclease SbcCD ATPase subunit